ncbi:hypothetical protein Sta7437_4625 (plasmid) [Stanieria cyanosphaera PCC 7437]|uniref:Uncharacterized protein n=1 Tax=Stanieria cyanosphaera (strain ATCC 29371 / PCC 7437) TaxID=111780 RepID=K9Y013_STAC7|nr:hypothetical protein [Stanieria cyanosphaera]AFZ38083.1 hypothetical protein Sta7437_4625 [Stanieria cyanosphaera PCC 7437]
MRPGQVLKTIKTSPQDWKIQFQNSAGIVFAYHDYRFARLSNRLGGKIMLKNKPQKIDMEWEADDPVASQLYMSLVSKAILEN